jgi:hypothetical protein
MIKKRGCGVNFKNADQQYKLTANRPGVPRKIAARRFNSEPTCIVFKRKLKTFKSPRNQPGPIITALTDCQSNANCDID